jgi:general secretion pathway protein G
MKMFRKSSSGFTFIELVVTTAVIMILASAALPLARVSIKRQREADLRRTLRDVRTAIDKFKDDADRGLIAPTELQFGSENYPSSLDQLIEGVSRANDATGRKMKYLRRIPMDAITGKAEWGMRSFQDGPTSTAWGGQNLYDIYSKAEGKALDGTKYKDW